MTLLQSPRARTRNRRPPTIVVNSSDHRFWLGVRSDGHGGHLRSAAAALNRERRGIDDDRSSVLPLPLDPPDRTLNPEKRSPRSESILTIS